MGLVSKILFAIGALAVLLYAKTGKELAEELKINAGSKAIVQWERIFGDEKRLKKIGADTLNADDLKALKEYVINHAADSDQPAAAGL